MSPLPSTHADGPIFEPIYKQLLEENARLRTLVNANQCDIEITGPCGFPTYASCDLKDTMDDSFTMSHKPAFGHQLLSFEVHVRGIGKVATFSEIITSKAWIAKDIHKGGFRLEASMGVTSPLPFLHISFGDECDEDQLRALRKLLNNPSKANQRAFSKEWIFGHGFMIPIIFQEFEASGSVFEKVIEEKSSVGLSWCSTHRSHFITQIGSNSHVALEVDIPPE